MKREHDDDAHRPVSEHTTSDVFLLPETRIQVIEHSVVKRVFHTYAAWLCVSHGCYASTSSLIKQHFDDHALKRSDALILHRDSPKLTLSRWDCITDCTLREIGTRLTELYLHQDPPIRGATLKRMTNLTCLHIAVDNRYVEGRHLTGLSALTDLKLHGNHLVTSKSLGTMTQLKQLNLYADEMIESFALHTLTGLVSLGLSGDNLIESSGLQNLGSCLTRLDLLSNRVIDDSGLEPLSNLRSLTLGGKPGLVTGQGISHLTQLTKLRLQDVDTVCDTELARLTGLCDLCLSYNTRITDIGLAPLTGLTSLRIMNNTVIGDAGLSPLTNLRTLYISTKSRVSHSVIFSLPHLDSPVWTV